MLATPLAITILRIPRAVVVGKPKSRETIKKTDLVDKVEIIVPSGIFVKIPVQDSTNGKGDIMVYDERRRDKDHLGGTSVNVFGYPTETIEKPGKKLIGLNIEVEYKYNDKENLVNLP